MKKFESFEEFWPFYLFEHQNENNRFLHYTGTTLVILFLVDCLITRNFVWMPLALVIGYGFAWTGHYRYEGNKPATFEYPLWSLQGELKMLFLFYRGKLPNELKKYNLR
jgi:hypothetical protein